MIQRRKTRTVNVGSVRLGSGNPVVIQSMTKVETTNIGACLEQVNQLAQAGCELVRIAVPTGKDTAALQRIIADSPVPIVADVHFSVARALEAIEAGAAKIRLNPGNITEPGDIEKIIDAAKANGVAIRVGVNEASIRDLNEDTAAEQRTALMMRKLRDYIDIFESRGFEQIVLSAKSTDPLRTIETNRQIAANFDYPIHLGLTHAGLPEDARVPSAVTLGTLLAEGIGDTVRVSLAGNPVGEAELAKEILISLGLHERVGPELIVCPTCGRTQTEIISLAQKVKEALKDSDKKIRIAVMGCVVNGPGEAADADIAVCAGKNKAVFYRDGAKIKTVPESEIIQVLLEQIESF